VKARDRSFVIAVDLDQRFAVNETAGKQELK